MSAADQSRLDPMEAALRPALMAVRRAATVEAQETAQAAYEVGYERGFIAGYEAAERDNTKEKQ